jgi:CheY-like chemotaxis protein
VEDNNQYVFSKNIGKKILPNATFLKQATEMKPYCILKKKPDIVLMDIQMPNKMDMKQRDSLIVLWVQIPIVA